MRFYLRDLIWLTLVVAMGLGRWLDSAGAIQLRLRVHDLEVSNRRQIQEQDYLMESIWKHLPPNKFALAHTNQGWELRERTNLSP